MSGYRTLPVVVIDPEDAEQVERLAQTLWSHQQVREPGVALDLAAVLREFAAPTPPEPDEPQGLGAVVEDADGVLWVRTVLPSEEEDVYRKPWSDGPVRRNWHIVEAVRVLSEGVTR